MKKTLFILICSTIILGCEEPTSTPGPSIDLTKSNGGIVIQDSSLGRSIRVLFINERQSKANKEKLAEFVNSGKYNIIKIDMKTSNSGWVHWIAVYYTEPQ